MKKEARNIMYKRVTNICFNTKCEEFKEYSSQEFLNYLIETDWFNYIIFQKEETKEKEKHWQGYVELKRQKYLTQLRELLGFVEPRMKTKEQAINYCKKEKSRIESTYYEWGKKRRTKNAIKEQDKEPIEREGKWTLEYVLNKIRVGEITDLEKIHKKDPFLYWGFEKKLRKEYITSQPKNKNEGSPCKIIWLFGESGAGKSIYTKKLLKKEKWDEKLVAGIYPASMSYNEKIHFASWHERCGVLVIEEVDEDFPKNNNLINFIDRKGLLSADKYEIKNNFELIIVNSLYRPEQVFGYLGKKNSKQIFRRIWNKINGSKVLEIVANEKQLNKVKKVWDYQKLIDWYKPIVNEIKEPDYTLIERE